MLSLLIGEPPIGPDWHVAETAWLTPHLAAVFANPSLEVIAPVIEMEDIFSHLCEHLSQAQFGLKMLVVMLPQPCAVTIGMALERFPK